ncbi:uncharacterized protein BDW70DRAFT_145560 [Aspergillus foveolatus]|uniref:uncharacterized protein n=1 Tax=Aspergillus foveolatus TaxID=210207 RepID=UPI003CCCE431
MRTPTLVPPWQTISVWISTTLLNASSARRSGPSLRKLAPSRLALTSRSPGLGIFGRGRAHRRVGHLPSRAQETRPGVGVPLRSDPLMSRHHSIKAKYLIQWLYQYVRPYC